MHKLLGTLLLLSLSHFSSAAVNIPLNLKQSERESTLRLLGLGTSTKILSAPYPLGGYAGFEFGFGMEFIDVSDIGSMGSRLSSPQDIINYPRFSFGKGFYNNMDLFFHYTPYNDVSGISDYGGLLRWGFYQSTYLPTSISLLLHSNATNISSSANGTALSPRLYTTSYGADIIAGFSLKYLSLYFGGGQTYSNGVFMDDTSTTIPSTQQETVNSIHTLMGGIIDFQQFFVAAQLDRYSDAIYSIKFGYKN